MYEIKKLINKGDYLYALVPDHPKATKNGYVLAHRVIMEQSLGRFLEEGEVVHHINKDKHDNRIENLQLMNNKEHNRFHGYERKHEYVFICKNCGETFDRKYGNRPDVKGYKNSFCSRRCNGIYNGFRPS